MATLLITTQEITKTSLIGGNVDVDTYAAIIEESQDFVLEKILGTKLIEKIKTDYAADNLAGHYLTIRDKYIVPILAYTVASEYALAANFQARNGGLFKHTAQNAEPVSTKEADFISNKQATKADVWIQRLIKFLCDKDAEIPEYTSSQDEDHDTKPDRNIKTFGGWYFGEGYTGRSSALKSFYNDIWVDEGQG